jgi:serralysin
MATMAELRAFADRTTFDIPYIDYQVGVPTELALKGYASLPASGTGITYYAANNTVYIKGDNIQVKGFDFSGTKVVVMGNNVTIENCRFDAKADWHALTLVNGYNGMTVTRSTFDGLKLDKPYGHFINSGDGKVNINHNEFVNAPRDAITVANGTVDHNYFNGAGYQAGSHADAIWVYKTTGAVQITNNFVDSRKPIDAPMAPNNAVQIVNKFGEVHDVTVSNNVMLGGTYTVNVEDITDYQMSRISIKDNFVANGLYGDLYPNNRPSELFYSNNTATKITETIEPAQINFKGIVVRGTAGKTGEELIGTAGSDYIYGHGDGDKLVGGGGRDFIFGGKGVDFFVYKDFRDSAPSLADYISGFEKGIDKIDLSALGNTAAFGAAALKLLDGGAFAGGKGDIFISKTATYTALNIDLNGDKQADMRIELQGNHTISSSDLILTTAPTATAPTTVATTTAPLAPAQAPVTGQVVQGTSGSDHIFAKSDGNQLIGGGGRDFVFCGKGADILVYRSISDSTGRLTDVVANYQGGVDKIDLRMLAQSNGTEALTLKFIGSAAFTGEKGAVHAVQTAVSTWVEADLNGDKVADLRIELQGLHKLVGSDFLL